MLLPVNLRTLPNRQGDLASDWWSHVTVDERAGKIKSIAIVIWYFKQFLTVNNIL
jgi:hypothetical protein